MKNAIQVYLRYHFNHACHTHLGYAVAIFQLGDKIWRNLSLWQKFEKYWTFLKVYLVFEIFGTYFGNFLCYSANFYCCDWPNIIWSHWLTKMFRPSFSFNQTVLTVLLQHQVTTTISPKTPKIKPPIIVHRGDQSEVNINDIFSSFSSSSSFSNHLNRSIPSRERLTYN